LKWHRNFAEGLLYNDQALALYDPVEDRPLATRFLQDPRVLNLMSRSGALWELGYPEAALADAEQALSEAREIGHAGGVDACDYEYMLDPSHKRQLRNSAGAI
jgi:predicted ATPase